MTKRRKARTSAHSLLFGARMGSRVHTLALVVACSAAFASPMIGTKFSVAVPVHLSDALNAQESPMRRESRQVRPVSDRQVGKPIMDETGRYCGFYRTDQAQATGLPIARSAYGPLNDFGSHLGTFQQVEFSGRSRIFSGISDNFCKVISQFFLRNVSILYPFS